MILGAAAVAGAARRADPVLRPAGAQFRLVADLFRRATTSSSALVVIIAMAGDRRDGGRQILPPAPRWRECCSFPIWRGWCSRRRSITTIGQPQPGRGKQRCSGLTGELTMQSENRMFDDLVKMVNGVAGTMAGHGPRGRNRRCAKRCANGSAGSISSAATSSRRSRRWPPPRATRMRRSRRASPRSRQGRRRRGAKPAPSRATPKPKAGA